MVKEKLAIGAKALVFAVNSLLGWLSECGRMRYE